MDTDLFRITATDFEFLLSLIGSVIVKSNEFRAPISPPEILLSLAHSNTEYVLQCDQRFVVPSGLKNPHAHNHRPRHKHIRGTR